MPNDLIFYAFLGGLLPTIFWLWFWLHEDQLHPEPKKYIFYTFIFGIFSAMLVLPAEEFLAKLIPGTGILAIGVLASAEEIFKYFGAYISSLRKKYMDEPIDAVIYLITAALGFAALENSLFLISALKNDLASIDRLALIGNMRFIGATLLHTLCSGIIGFFIGFSFFKSKTVKRTFLFLGIAVAIVLHTLFNFFILKSGNNILIIFLGIWVAIILLILILEKVKLARKRKTSNL